MNGEPTLEQRVTDLETRVEILGSFVARAVKILEHSVRLSHEIKVTLGEMADDAERMEKLILAYMKEGDDALE